MHCPKCDSIINNDSESCKFCKIELKKTNSSAVKIEAHQKIDDLEILFKKKNIPVGNLFFPNDDFYVQWDGSGDALRFMALKIMEYLNLEPKELAIDFYSNMEPPGLYMREEKPQLILINSKHQNNPFECAAILAHELMHYFLIGRCKIELEDQHENELMTDLATIYSGLGILIVNSFFHDNKWHETIAGLAFGIIRTHEEKRSFGYYEPNQYGNHFKEYINKYDLNTADIVNHTLPHSRYFLGLAQTTTGTIESPGYMVMAKKQSKKSFMLRILFLCIAIPIGLTFLAWRTGAFNTTKSLDDLSATDRAQVEQLKTEMNSDKSSVESCNKELEALNNQLNNINLKMNNLENQGYNDEFNNLVPSQNNLTNNYNSLKVDCGNKTDTFNKKVDEYNNLIKK